MPVLAPHPAQYSDAVLESFEHLIDKYALGGVFLDPFAGIGVKVDRLPMTVIKVELQHAWARQAQSGMVQADSRHLPFADAVFDGFVTSVVYGNRMSDRHVARDASKRITYRHSLDVVGEELDERNAGGLQFGGSQHQTELYLDLHAAVYTECWRVARRGACFLLNVSDHIRRGRRVGTVSAHRALMRNAGWTLLTVELVKTPRMRMGRNHSARVQAEAVLLFQKLR